MAIGNEIQSAETPAPVRIGMIGCGMTLSVLYGPALAQLPELRLVAVSDPKPEARHHAQERWGVASAYERAEDMLASESLDGVIVATPPFMHAEHVAAVARAGCQVLCQKPMAPTVAEARRMIDVCSDANVLLMMTFNRRLFPPLWTLTQLVESGSLGEVFAAEFIWTSWSADGDCGFRDSAACLGGNFQDHGAHTFDLAERWLGPIATLSAQAFQVGPRIGRPRGVEDHVSALASHANGTGSVHIHSRASHRPVSELYRVCGTTGTVEAEYTGDWSVFCHDAWDIRLFRKGVARPERLMARRPEYDHLETISDTTYAFWWELKNFAAAIRAKNLHAEPGGEAGLRAVQAVAASLLSALEQRTVPLSEADRLDPARYARLMERLALKEV